MLSRIILIAALTAQSLSAAEAVDSKRAANTVVLDETGVANLKLETETVEEGDFEESVFALGRIEIIPARRSGVSSRAEGRLTELKFTLGDQVTAGAEVAKLESRQYGNPPPILTLTAPAAGTVTKVSVAVGEPVEPATTLVEITDFSQVYAVARVPEHEAGKMKAGTAARIKVAALPGEKFEGELLRFGTEADRESGTIDAVFMLPNPNLTLRPGMRSEFAIITETREGVMSIPRAALQGDAVNRYVYVKDFGLKNAFIKTPVVIGKITDSKVEVTSGLLTADEVVVRGAYSLAFAGGGSVSLKEALDAAHGHEHNADGSELTAEQKAAKGAAKGEGGHAHAEEQGGDMLWKVLCGVLALVVVGQALKGRKKTDTPETKPAVQPKPEEA